MRIHSFTLVAALAVSSLGTLGCKDEDKKEAKQTPVDKLIGTWHREGDEMDGLEVEVTRTGEIVEGKIVTECHGSYFCKGFTVGDIKWRNIQAMDDKTIKVESLSKKVFPNGTVQSTEYLPSRYEFVSDDELNSRVDVDTGDVGTTQVWKRVK